MTWAPSETQIAVYTQLNSDAALTTLLGGANRIYDHVPDNTNYPYITLNIVPFTDRGSYTTEGVAVEFQVSIWVRGTGLGAKQLQALQKRVDELIHEANLSISGWNIITIRRSLIDQQVENDNVTRQGIQRFTLLLGES